MIFDIFFEKFLVKTFFYFGLKYLVLKKDVPSFFFSLK